MARHKFKAHNMMDARDEKDWLISYADVVTLLLTFFILMITVSSVDAIKVENLKRGLAESVSKKQFTSNDFSQVQDDLIQVLEGLDTRNNVTVVLSPTGVNLEFSNVALYDSGSADFKDDAIPILDAVTHVLGGYSDKKFLVEISGHTDDVMINTEKFPSNWELSAARATNIVRYFIKKGIPSYSLKASGYADSRPKNKVFNDLGYTEIQRAENRRVVIEITK